MRARGLPRSRPQYEGHGAPRGAHVLSRFLCDQEAHRLTALHGGDFGRGDRASGTGQTRHAPRSGWLSPAFILSASSRERQSHVVGPDGDPSLPDDVAARHVRGRRILLRFMSALEKRPSRTGHAEHRRGSKRGDAYPHHEMLRGYARKNYPLSFRGARRRASPESMVTNEIPAIWIPGLRQAAHPGMTCGEIAALNPGSCYARSILSAVIPGRASSREPGIHA